MKVIYQRLREPLLTEKTTEKKETDNTLCFVVHPKSNKLEIKEAVERLFDVKVEHVRTINMTGKPKRLGRFEGKRSSWKKAYVKLKKGERTIEFFEGV